MADHDTHDHAGVTGVPAAAADLTFDPTGLDNTAATDVQAAMADFDAAITAAGGGGSSFVGAKAYSSATQGSISATTMTAVTLNAEEYDTSSFHDNVTNNSRLTVPSTGYYSIKGYVFGGTSTPRVILANFFKNNTTVLRGQVRYDASGNAIAVNLTCDASLTASDYIEMRVWCSGSDLTLGDATNIEQQCWMSIALMGA